MPKERMKITTLDARLDVVWVSTRQIFLTVVYFGQDNKRCLMKSSCSLTWKIMNMTPSKEEHDIVTLESNAVRIYNTPCE